MSYVAVLDALDALDALYGIITVRQHSTVDLGYDTYNDITFPRDQIVTRKVIGLTRECVYVQAY